MRIIKSSSDLARFKEQREKANAGCDVCPCCGETKSSFQYIEEGVYDKGIMSGICKTWCEGVFHIRSMKCDCYKCHSCGAEWESEPYQWA